MCIRDRSLVRGFGQGRSQLILTAGTDFAVWLGSGAIFPYLPVFLKEQAHASVALIGLIAAAYFVGVFASSAYFGRLSDRLGRKPMIITGTVLYALATALFLTTTHPSWFIVFRFVEGTGAAAGTTAAAPVPSTKRKTMNQAGCVVVRNSAVASA